MPPSALLLCHRPLTYLTYRQVFSEILLTESYRQHILAAIVQHFQNRYLWRKLRQASGISSLWSSYDCSHPVRKTPPRHHEQASSGGRVSMWIHRRRGWDGCCAVYFLSRYFLMVLPDGKRQNTWRCSASDSASRCFMSASRAKWNVRGCFTLLLGFRDIIHPSRRFRVSVRRLLGLEAFAWCFNKRSYLSISIRLPFLVF